MRSDPARARICANQAYRARMSRPSGRQRGRGGAMLCQPNRAANPPGPREHVELSRSFPHNLLRILCERSPESANERPIATAVHLVCGRANQLLVDIAAGARDTRAANLRLRRREPHRLRAAWYKCGAAFKEANIGRVFFAIRYPRVKDISDRGVRRSGSDNSTTRQRVAQGPKQFRAKLLPRLDRSEERRVGKECRSR